MSPQNRLCKIHCQGTTKNKTSTAKCVTNLDRETHNVKGIEIKLLKENELLRKENDLIREKLKKFCLNLKRRKVAASSSSPISCCNGSDMTSPEINSVQSLDGLFRYVEELEKITDTQNSENALINKKSEFLSRENNLLIKALQKDGHSEQGSEGNRNSIIEQRQLEIQHLKHSITEKDKQILRLQKALHCISQVSKSQMNALETDGKNVEGQLNYMSELLARCSKKYSLQNSSNSSKANETMVITPNKCSNVEKSFMVAFMRLSSIMEKYCQMQSLEEVSKRADVVNSERNLKLIYQLQEELNLYEEQINAFQGTRESKSFLHIQEMLLRIVLKLDLLESQKKGDVIKERKQTILRVKYLQRLLEQCVIKEDLCG